MVSMPIAYAAPDAWPQFRGPWGNGLTAASGRCVARRIASPLERDRERGPWKTPSAVAGVVVALLVDERQGVDDVGHGRRSRVPCPCRRQRVRQAPPRQDPLHLRTTLSRSATRSTATPHRRPSPSPEGSTSISAATAPPASTPPAATCSGRRTTCLAATSGGPVRRPSSSRTCSSSPSTASTCSTSSPLDKKTGERVWKTDRTTQWADLDDAGKPKRDGGFPQGFHDAPRLHRWRPSPID